MIKHIEIKTYKHLGIGISIKINYDKKEISMVENNTGDMSTNKWTDKSWKFVGRGLEYMNGWMNVFNAMKYAVDEASRELKQYNEEKIKEKEDTIEDLLIEANQRNIKMGINKKKN